MMLFIFSMRICVYISCAYAHNHHRCDHSCSDSFPFFVLNICAQKITTASDILSCLHVPCGLSTHSCLVYCACSSFSLGITTRMLGRVVLCCRLVRWRSSKPWRLLVAGYGPTVTLQRWDMEHPRTRSLSNLPCYCLERDQPTPHCWPSAPWLAQNRLRPSAHLQDPCPRRLLPW